MSKTKVEIIPCTEPTELYEQYDGQNEPQPCYVALNLESGKLYADVDHAIGGGVPADVWHHRTLRWGIPTLTAEAANALLKEIAPIAQRVLDGAEVEWDGNNNVGHLDEDAEEARGEIQRLCEAAGGEDDEVNVWDAADWYVDGPKSVGITADTTDEQLQALEEKCDAESEQVDPRRVLIINDTLKLFTDWRDRLRDEREAEMAEMTEGEA